MSALSWSMVLGPGVLSHRIVAKRLALWPTSQFHVSPFDTRLPIGEACSHVKAHGISRICMNTVKCSDGKDNSNSSIWFLVSSMLCDMGEVMLIFMSRMMISGGSRDLCVKDNSINAMKEKGRGI